MAYTRADLEWAGERPPGEREPLPVAGERVLFRRELGGPVIGAVITDVQDVTAHNDGHGGGDPDPNVWYPPIHERSAQLRDDPWPWVTLKLDDGCEERVKEARLRGSPGWLRP